MNYTALVVDVKPLLPWRDILISDLADFGFESFEETSSGLKAYIPEQELEENKLMLFFEQYPKDGLDVNWTLEKIKHQNWNATWEEDFEPIEINDKCRIKAPFHKLDNREYDVLIVPQMSFGTGHHETTFLMCQALFKLSITQQRVLDMGCGTGVLAFLAAKLNAKAVTAIDIDEHAVENAQSNLALNNLTSVRIFSGGADKIVDEYDVILANINKNILMQDMKRYANSLPVDGMLLLSGFFKTDVEELIACGSKYDLQFVNSETKNNWAIIQLKKV